MLGAAHDDVCLDTDLAELGDGLLGGLGFDLTCSGDEREEGDVYEADICPTYF